MQKTVVLAASFLLVASLSSQTRTDPSLTELAHDFAAAFNAKDAAKIGSFYTDGATLMPPNQPAVQGRQNIAAWFKEGIDEGFTNFQLRPTESAIAGDQAFEAGTYSLQMKPGGASGSGGAPVTDKGKYVVIYKRIAGEWKLAYDIFNSDLPHELAK